MFSRANEGYSRVRGNKTGNRDDIEIRRCRRWPEFLRKIKPRLTIKIFAGFKAASPTGTHIVNGNGARGGRSLNKRRPALTGRQARRVINRRSKLRQKIARASLSSAIMPDSPSAPCSVPSSSRSQSSPFRAWATNQSSRTRQEAAAV